MNLYSLPTIFNSLLVICLGLLVYKRNPRNQANRGFFYITLATFLWLFFASLAYNCKNKNLVDIYFRICYVGVANIVTTGLFFTLSFLKGIFSKNLKKLIFVIGATWSLSILFTKFVISDLHKYFWGYYPKAGILHPFFLVSFIIIYLGCIINLFHYLNDLKVPKLKKIQIKNIIFAFLIFCLASIDFVGNYGFEMFPFGFIPVSGFLAIIAYSVIKYRFLDVSIVITRTGIFIAVYSLILGTPFIVACCYQPFFIGLLGNNWWLVPMGLLTVMATAGPFIYIYINSRAEDRLLREQRRYQQTLRQASSGMIRVRELRRLLHLIVHVVTKTVKIEFASIFLLDSENNHYTMVANRGSLKLSKQYASDIESPLVKHLHLLREPLVYEEIQLQSQDNPHDSRLVNLERQLGEMGAAVVIPSFVGNKLLGFIVLGKKLSGKIYSQDDLNVFSVLANQMALGVENALAYEEVRNTRSQLLELEKLAIAGKLAGQVGHELKNPLTAIKTFTEYLDEKFDDAEFRKKFSEVVGSEIDRLHTLASQLLDISKPRKPELKDNVDVHQIIEATVFLLEKEAAQQGISLRCDFTAKQSAIKADSNQLKQCFLNLILNSFQAIQQHPHPDKKEVLLITKNSSTAKLNIEVSDSGKGIPESDLPYIFEPFFTTKEKGSGLGLSIIQGIILAHNGKISCQSQINKGTTFTIELALF